MADEKVLKIFKELADLHKAKDADYAGGEPLSNFKRCEQFGIPAWKGVAVRLSDKWSRFVSMASSEGRHCVEGESLDDTLSDLAVYAVICLALRKKVADEPLVDEISISGDRVKREGPSWDKYKKGWDEAKQEPHVYVVLEPDSSSAINDDDSVITSQADCAKRFAEGEAVRSNYAGIND